MKRLFAATVAAAVLMSGCAAASKRVIAFPTKDQSQDQIILDQHACETIADSHKGSDASAAIAGGMLGVTVGAVGGAALGAISGAVLSGISAGRGSLIGLAIGGGTGLIVGIIKGAQENDLRYMRIYAACLVAKGYTIGG
jgi:hypothetical protein